MWNNDQASTIARHLRELSLTFAFQTGLQGIAVATGLLIIHAISKEEYGLYSIVGSVQGMAVVLADSGILSAVSSLLGKTWNDPGANLGVILTALRERQRLLAGVIPVCVAMMLLVAAGKTSGMNILVMELAMISCVYLDVGTHLYQMIPLYTGKRNALQILQVILGTGRIGVIIALALGHEVNVVALLTLNVVCCFVGRYFIRNLAVGKIPLKPSFDPNLRQDIHRIILRMLPSSAFYAFQGQITTYVMSIFGQLADIGSVAALGRIGLLFSLLLNVISTLGMPAFSKAGTKAEGLRIFWLIVGSVALFSLLFFGLSLLIPGLMLQILGKNYASLTVELQITVLATGVAALSGTIWTLVAARGLIGQAWLNILVILAVQIGYAALGELHTVRGVLWFSLATACASLLGSSAQAYWFILRPKELGRNH